MIELSRYALPVIFLYMSGLFTFHFIKGLRSGKVSLPIQLIGIETFDRDSIWYNGLVGLNALLAVTTLALSYFAFDLRWSDIPYRLEQETKNETR